MCKPEKHDTQHVAIDVVFDNEMTAVKPYVYGVITTMLHNDCL